MIEGLGGATKYLGAEMGCKVEAKTFNAPRCLVLPAAGLAYTAASRFILVGGLHNRGVRGTNRIAQCQSEQECAQQQRLSTWDSIPHVTIMRRSS